MKYIVAVIAGIAIFVLEKIIGILIRRAGRKFSYWKKVYRIYPVFELIVWTTFVFWVTGLLFRDQIFYPYIVVAMALIVICLVVWYLIRDVFAGALFKMQNNLNQGDTIKTGIVSGQVKSLKLSYLEVITDDGHSTKIPYTKLNSKEISYITNKGKTEEYKIRLTFDKQITKQEIEEKIRNRIASSPWCDYKRPPVIKFLWEDENSYSYDVLIYTLSQKHLRLIEKTLL